MTRQILRAAGRRGAAVVLLVGVVGCAGRTEKKAEEALPADEPVDAQTLARGRDLYLRSGCQVCHGELGHGDGGVAATLRPAPRDFRNTRAYKHGTAIADIEAALAKGMPGAAMAPYSHLTSAQRRLLALYVRHLAGQ